MVTNFNLILASTVTQVVYEVLQPTFKQAGYPTENSKYSPMIYAVFLKTAVPVRTCSGRGSTATFGGLDCLSICRR